MINTGQAAKAAAGSILPGGPGSARVTWGRGPQPGSGALGREGRGQQERQASLPQSFIPPPTHSFAHMCSVHKYLLSTNYAPGLGSGPQGEQDSSSIELMFYWERERQHTNEKQN